jgi:hypothetical protein
MANGNLGDLWFKLGVRTDNNSINKMLRDIQQLDGLILKINKEIVAGTKGGTSKDDQKKLNNALDYLNILQKVNREIRSIEGLKKINVGTDTTELDKALRLAKDFRKEMIDLQMLKHGGTDSAFMPGFGKAWRNTLGDLRDIEKLYQKENTLTDAKNNQAKLNIGLEKTKQKLSEIHSLQSMGIKGGFNTSALLSGSNTLRGVKTRIEKMLGDPNLLNNEAKVKSLISDISYAYTKATGKVKEFNIERAKTVQQRGIDKQITTETNIAENRIASLTRTLGLLQEQYKKSSNARLDTTNITTEINRINSLVRQLSSIKDDLGKRGRFALGQIGNIGNGNDIARAKDVLKEAAQAQKENTQAKKEAASTEKQYQKELETSLQRIQSVEKALNKLKGVTFTSKGFGFDVSEADSKIKHLETQLNHLKSVRDMLSKRQDGALGLLGNVGNGREVTSANNLASEMARVNAQAQKGIELEGKRQQEIQKSASTAQNDLARAFASANSEAKKMQSTVSDIKSLFLQGGLVYGAKTFFDSIVQTGGEIAQQHIALRSILGDKVKADKLFSQTQDLALQSPFKFGELNRDIKQLAAYGVEADELYDTAKRLADISSGLGVSFERLGLAFGQVKARSWLDGKELRQFAYAGLPMLQKITDLYNKEGKNGKNDYTTSDVKSMISKREVSYDDVKKVLWEMTDEGGQFYNMQLELSETLLGRWNKLIDAWDIMVGKFAEGDSFVSKFFAAGINGAANLVLSLDKLSPALLSLTAVFAGKKLVGAIAGSSLFSNKGITKNLDAATNAELKAYAIKQQELVVQGKITSLKASQNLQEQKALLNSQASISNAYTRLALEGKMNVLQLQRARSQGLISPMLVHELQILGQITAKQEQIILGTSRMAAGWATVKGAVSKGFSLIGGWWGLALAGITQLYSSISSEFEAIDQKTEELKNSSALINGADEILSQGKPTDDNSLRERIEKMKTLLQENGKYTEALKAQVEKTTELSKQYDILIEATRQVKSNASFEAGMTAKAIGATGGWMAGNPFDDTIEENIKDLEESAGQCETQLSGLSASAKQHMQTVFASMDKAKYGAGSLVDKLRELSKSENNADWAYFSEQLRNNGAEMESITGILDKIRSSSKATTSDILEIAKNDLPKLFSSMQKSLNLYGKDFQNWCKNNSTDFRNMLLNIMDEAKWQIPEIRAELEKLTGFKFTPSGKGGDNALDDGDVMQVVRKNLKSDPKKLAAIKPYINDSSFYDTKNKLQTELQGLWNEYKSRENTFKNTGNGEKKMQEAQKKYQDLWNLANEALGYKYSPEDKKSNKTPKVRTRQEDTQLKSWRERLEAYKAARQMYQKYKGVMGEKAAKDEVGSLYGDTIKGLDLDDYIKSLEKLEKQLTPKTAERKRAITSLKKEISEWKFSEQLEPEMKRVAAAFKAALEDGAKKSELYKELFEKTGDKEFASNAYRDGEVWNDESRGLSQLFKEKTGMEVDLDANPENVKDMLEKKMGSINGDAMYEVWQRIVELVRGGYTDALKEAAELLNKNLDTANQIAILEEKYEKLRDGMRQSGTPSQGALNLSRYQQDKEVGQIKDKQAQQSPGYLLFFSQAVNLGKEKLTQLANALKGELKDALDSGAISVKDYAERLDKINSRMSGIGSTTNNGPGSKVGSFLSGGLQGVANMMQGQAQAQMSDAQAQYGMFQNQYSQALANNDLGGMASSMQGMQNAQSAMDIAGQAGEAAQGMGGAVGIIDKIVHGINGVVQGLNDSFNLIKDMETALGKDTEDDNWTDTGTFFSTFASASQSATDGWDSLKEGNVGGVISGVIGSWTNWWTGFAQGHDQKLENHIKIAERSQKLLENIADNVSTVVERTLGGVYEYKASNYTKTGLEKVKSDYETRTEKQKRLYEYRVMTRTIKEGQTYEDMSNSSINKIAKYSKDTYEQVCKALNTGTAYDTELASLKGQRDEIQQKVDKENAKKNTDKDKIADYEKELADIEESIESFTQDFLKDVYSVDLKSWASELTSAVVDAWSNGEDAIDAYKDKAKEMLKELATTIVSQKIMEKAMEPVLDYLEDELNENGVLGEKSIEKLGSLLNEAADTAVPQITAFFDELKRNGWDLSGNGTTSTSNSIKSITEETADIIASYLNAIRLDVSVNRENIKLIADAVTGIPELNTIAESQLQSLNQIVILAQYRNDKLDDMYTWMKHVSTGVEKLYVN